MISELFGKAEQNEQTVSPRKINEPRLGMAMKECLWKGRPGRDIHDNNRNAFIDYTIDTYNLFTEIAERLGNEEQAQ
jgi:hypothetical protein